jgi:hypothetical protein
MKRLVLVLATIVLAACGGDSPAGLGGGNAYAVRVTNLGSTLATFDYQVRYRYSDGEDAILFGGSLAAGASSLDPFLFSDAGASGAGVRFDVAQGNIRVELLRGTESGFTGGQGTVVSSGSQTAPGRIDLVHGSAPSMP